MKPCLLNLSSRLFWLSEYIATLHYIHGNYFLEVLDHALEDLSRFLNAMAHRCPSSDQF